MDSIPPTVDISFLSHYSAVTFTPNTHTYTQRNTHPPTHSHTNARLYDYCCSQNPSKKHLVVLLRWKQEHIVLKIKSSSVSLWELETGVKTRNNPFPINMFIVILHMWFLNNARETIYSMKCQLEPADTEVKRYFSVCMWLYSSEGVNSMWHVSKEQEEFIWTWIMVAFRGGKTVALTAKKKEKMFKCLLWKGSVCE